MDLPGVLDAFLACHVAALLGGTGSSFAATAEAARSVWQAAPLSKDAIKGLTAHCWLPCAADVAEGQLQAKLAAVRVQAALYVCDLGGADKRSPFAKGVLCRMSPMRLPSSAPDIEGEPSAGCTGRWGPLRARAV